MNDEDPTITIEFDDSKVVISFKFDDDFPIEPSSFVTATGELLMRELS